MNLNDLKNIDIKSINLKSIDLSKIRSVLLQRQDLLGNGTAVFLMLFIVFKIFSWQQKEVNNLKFQAGQMGKKVAAITKHDQALKELNALVASLPVGISESALIDQVTDFAEKWDIHIVTFSPTKTQQNEFYLRSSVTLEIVADNYKNLVQFFHDLENSSLNLRVDKWLGGPEIQKQSKQSSPQLYPGKNNKTKRDESIRILMDLSAVYFFKKT